VVQFALHGCLDPEFPSMSALVFSEASGIDGDRGAEDGYLSAEEVAGLRFRADLVTLSACRSGPGKPGRAEGVTGLPRAFMLSGANRVAMTLWQVDDAATRTFLVRLYGRVVKDGLGFADAMTLTKREFLRNPEFQDPYFWGSFVLYGD
jgi:CHAT domain-containing protein